MTKRVLFGLIICSLIVAGTLTFQRIKIEQSNQTVELIADFQDFARLTTSELTIENILAQLRQLGVSKVALTEITVGERLLSQPTFGVKDYYPLAEIISEPAGFNQEELKLVNSAYLEAVPKVLASSLVPISFQEKLTDFDSEMVIFSGNQIIGYPGDLVKTAAALKENDLVIGLVEFSSQRGINQITTGSNVVRVHAITLGEMRVLSKERIINRYLRAVKERNIRGLYLRPLAENWEATVDLLQDLTNDLQAAGFKLGKAQPYPQWNPSWFYSWLCSLGVLAAFALLIQRYVVLNEKVLWLAYIVVALLGLAGFYSYALLFKQAFALLAAIVFPVLGIVNYDFFKHSIVKNYLLVSAISFVGGILVVGLLTGTSFLVKLVEFRGVKLMHVAPIILAFIYGLFVNNFPLKGWDDFKNWIKQIWYDAIPVKYLAAGLFVLAVAGIYILRTGNFGLPVMELEIKLREALERLLLVRPRLKEFLIGHPALVLLLASNHKQLRPILLSIAVIGQLSLVNTFTHIHTPVLLSLLRSIYGLVFGFAIGWLILRLCLILIRRTANDSRFWILRIPK